MQSVPPPAAGPPGLAEHPELPAGAEPGGPPRWPPWTAPVALVAALAMALLGGLVVALIAAAFGASDLEDPGPGVLIASTIVQDIALVGAAILFAAAVRGPLPAHFGIKLVTARAAIGAIVLGWITFIGFSAAWAGLLRIDEEDDLPQELGADESTLAMLAVALLVTVVAPICEEFFFRGYFYTAVSRWRGHWMGAILTGIVFGGIHAGSSPVEFLVPLAFFGAVLCVVYRATGSLLPAIVLHALNNCLAFGVTQDWTVGETALLMVIANGLILALLLPLARRQPLLAPG